MCASRKAAIAYVDWSTQEIAIAAGLSGDERMTEAYASGDVYLAFAKANRLVPLDATKDTHADFREVCKAIVLGINYGMGPETMAFKAGISKTEAREFLRLHKVHLPEILALHRRGRDFGAIQRTHAIGVRMAKICRA